MVEAWVRGEHLAADPEFENLLVRQSINPRGVLSAAPEGWIADGNERA